MPGRGEADTMATLLVRGSAPPTPSIWRGSGEPMAASSTRSRNAGSVGRSEARKNGPLEVPPRIRVQGIAVWDDGVMLLQFESLSWIRKKLGSSRRDSKSV